MKIISYYTPNYAGVANRLKESLDKFGQDYYVEHIDDQGSWEENCGYKHKFILECMKKFDEDLFWLDADAILLRKPTWKEFESDKKIGAHVHFHQEMQKWELLSGSIYIPNNEINKMIIKGWHNHQKNNPMAWDQRTLSEILNAIPDSENNWFVMDNKWCFVKEYMQCDDPIIYHYQESRNKR